VPRCWLLTSLLLERARGLRVESGNGEGPRKERSSLQELAGGSKTRSRSGAAVVWWRPAEGSDAAVVGWRPAVVGWRSAVVWWRPTEGSGAAVV
jgi:hypothetical protein